MKGKLSGIRKESVNYVGYYSQHEETMKALIQNQAKAGKILIAYSDKMLFLDLGPGTSDLGSLI